MVWNGLAGETNHFSCFPVSFFRGSTGCCLSFVLSCSFVFKFRGSIVVLLNIVIYSIFPLYRYRGVSVVWMEVGCRWHVIRSREFGIFHVR